MQVLKHPNTKLISPLYEPICVPIINNVIEKLKKEIPKIKFNLKELNSEKSKNEIIAKSTIAKTLGINGVPFFQFNKGYLSGAQPVENLEIAIKDNLV